MNEKEIKKLLNSKVFPHKVRYLKLRETYISWLIFTGNFVYKIKKPVKFSYLDFSSFQKRKIFLEEELRLNRRLTKEIYLDVVPIAESGGRLRILESSRAPIFKNEKIKDHALKMKEIPEKYYAPELLKRGKLRKNSVKKIAKIAADFHRTARTSPEINKYGSIKIIRKNCEENFRQMRPFVGKVVNETLYKFITEETRSFLNKTKALFLKRQKGKKIRDCHGDLHTENIFIAPQKIYIIDCIEFNKRFRYQDTASDVAFLAMDFDYLGKPDFSKYFIEQYNFELKDRDLYKIFPFYKCYRAYIRAKVGCFSLPKADMSSIQKYFSLAFKYAYEFSNPVVDFRHPDEVGIMRRSRSKIHYWAKRKPFLLVFCGEIGSGKSYLADYLSRITGARLFKSDVIRKEILGIPLFEHRKRSLEKIYSRAVTERVYKKMIGDGLKLLKKGELVILDATFPTDFYRKIVIDKAEKEKIPHLFVECRASEKKTLERLQERIKKKEISDATVQVYLQLKGKFEKIKLPKENYISIDTEKEDVNNEANKVLKKVLCLK